MKKIISVLFTVATLAAGTGMKADTVTFSLANSTTSLAGTITLGTEIAPGDYQIASIEGTFSDSNLGISDATFDTLVGGYGDASGGYLTSADDSWYYTNLVFPDGSPMFDVDGPVVALGSDELNWWSVGGGAYEAELSVAGQTQDYIDSEYLTPTPEPGSLVLLGTGLLIAAGIMFWGANKNSGASVSAAS